MQEGTSLRELFRVGTIDGTELAHTFSSIYNMASQHGEQVACNRGNDPVALVAVYDDGDLVDVLSGPGLGDEDVGKLKDEIEELLRPHTRAMYDAETAPLLSACRYQNAASFNNSVEARITQAVLGIGARHRPSVAS